MAAVPAGSAAIAAVPALLKDVAAVLMLSATIIASAAVVARYLIIPPAKRWVEKALGEQLPTAIASAITVALAPMTERVTRLEEQSIAKTEALIGVRGELRSLKDAQRSMHTDLRRHMRDEDTRRPR